MQESDVPGIDVEDVRRILKQECDDFSPVLVGELIGVHPQVLRDFADGKVFKPRGVNWTAIVGFADSVREGRRPLTRGRQLVPPVTTRGRTVEPQRLQGELRGRSIEVEALLAFALERQRLLTAALGGGQEEPDAETAAMLAPVQAATATPTGSPDATPARRRTGTAGR